MRAVLVVVLALAVLGWPAPTAVASTCQAHDGLPDSSCTPGERDARVTQATISTTICVKGWAKSVRPPKNVTDQIKRERMAAYGLSDPAGSYELDHLIPIELGGASTVANLWPQPWDGPLGAHTKDRLEDRLHSLVCSGRLALGAAQQQFSVDWVNAFHESFG